MELDSIPRVRRELEQGAAGDDAGDLRLGGRATPRGFSVLAASSLELLGACPLQSLTWPWAWGDRIFPVKQDMARSSPELGRGLARRGVD